MEKWVIASDIHGSAFYCRKLLSALEREQPEHILLLGDLLYHGPRNDLPEEYDPKAVIPMLNSLRGKLLCVRGNCDSEVDQMVITTPILADYAAVRMADRFVYATHGHVYNREHLLPLAKGDVLLHGHTHIPTWERFGEDNLLLNPGSVSIPKNGTPHSYMTAENGTFFWKTLEGEIFHTETLDNR